MNRHHLIIAALAYCKTAPETETAEVAAGPRGKIARYAWGEDYHDLIHGRLKQLVEFVRRHAPAQRPASGREPAARRPVARESRRWGSPRRVKR